MGDPYTAYAGFASSNPGKSCAAVIVVRGDKRRHKVTPVFDGDAIGAIHKSVDLAMQILNERHDKTAPAVIVTRSPEALRHIDPQHSGVSVVLDGHHEIVNEAMRLAYTTAFGDQ